jgi:serine phosphatase RsbU (regulator of sigma subunit)
LRNRENLKIKDIEFLQDTSGPRLGESESSVYVSVQMNLAQGDKIMLYTDGVTDTYFMLERAA